MCIFALLHLKSLYLEFLNFMWNHKLSFSESKTLRGDAGNHKALVMLFDVDVDTFMACKSWEIVHLTKMKVHSFSLFRFISS